VNIGWPDLEGRRCGRITIARGVTAAVRASQRPQRRMETFLIKLHADGGYQDLLFRCAVANIMARLNVEIVERSDHANGFVALSMSRRAGWSNEHSHGSGGAAVSPKIGSLSTERCSPFRSSLQALAQKTM
jgi:hypothetical protein